MYRTKRFVLSVVEDRGRVALLTEYVAARIGRDRAKLRLKACQTYIGWKREFERNLANEDLAVSRETIRVTGDMIAILRRY
jgi:hypothetical protein